MASFITNSCLLFAPSRLRRAYTCLREKAPAVRVDVVLFAFFMLALGLTSVFAQMLSIPGVPMSYLDLFILAPFLHRFAGRALMCISVGVAVARVVQGIFGFDQLFISSYMLLHNLPGFPVRYVVFLLTILVLAIGALWAFVRFLPRRCYRVSYWVVLLMIMMMGTGELIKRETKINLIGTSFGYLSGQLKFAQMLFGNYKIPLWRAGPYPGLMGAQAAVKLHTDYLLIVVESMGDPSSPALENYLFSSFDETALRSKYEVTKGQVPTRGSTIHGEIRELCGGMLSEGLYGKSSSDSCVPQMLAQHGYNTVAVHANHARMYGRDSWYPHVGFQTYINSESPRLPSKSLEYWWGSLLDPDALDWIRENYFQKNKDFVYWMTISTHVPPKLLPGAGINPLCDERGEVQACIHLANLRYVMDAVSKTAVELNQTTIVIVGDHPPPFASLSNRHMFKQDLVPYLMLVPKPVM